MKKWMIALSALLMVAVVFICVLPTNAFAEESTAEGMCGANVKWSVSGDTLTISGMGPMDDAVYSDVGGPWYEYKAQIRHVVIEEGVTYVGKMVFSNYRPLKSIKIADSVTTVGELAFFCCFDVEQIILGSGIETIEKEAFFSCFEVREIVLPQSLRSIGIEAFGDCWKLEKIEIPEGVTAIPVGAFRNTGIRAITIPESITEIGSCAFKNCDELEVVYYPGSREQWNAISVDNKDGCNDFLLNADFLFGKTPVGDITADGFVNNQDVVYLLWHTLFPEDYPLDIDGDITKDGSVNNQDVVYLLWYTLFPEEHPL